ncbi:hypothetical protein COL36_06505 [Bacillus wiedmannii]|uniref:hypothetical protein n=1 Tax=Bacillus wiedmannii TaxID=1890302 RepID=UPI000BF4A97A|nr:hypothetical protein [Bacillus wiedmannii]PFX62956.1 hypothetical protein COL36_06505 [Bacillus wiedmannii]
MKKMLFEQEYILIVEHMMTEEMKEYFPYEAQIRLDVVDMLKGVKIFCKEPQTPQQWHDHYMKESEECREQSERYRDRAKHYKEKAKEAVRK